MNKPGSGSVNEKGLAEALESAILDLLKSELDPLDRLKAVEAGTKLLAAKQKTGDAPTVKNSFFGKDK